MLSQLFKSLDTFLKYLAFIAGFTLLQTLAINALLQLPLTVILIDSLIYTLIYVIIGLLLWNTIKYGRFETLPFIQELLIYTALVLLSLLGIYAIGLGVYEYVLSNNSDILLSFLPVRLLLSFLVLLLLIQHFKYKICEFLESEIPLNEQLILNENKEEEKAISTEILERIAVKSNQKIHVILVSEIIYLQADGDYVLIFTSTGKYLKEQTMKYFEVNLPSNLFVRIHRSCIVNIQTITRIELYDKQNQQLTLNNGHKVKVSVAGYKSLRKVLNL